MTETKLHTIKVGSNVLSLVSQVYLANAYRDGRLPGIYSHAPYLIIGGEGFYAVPVDTEVYEYLAEGEENAILTEDYDIEEDYDDSVDAEDVAAVSRLIDQLAEVRQDKEQELASLDSEFLAALEAEIGADNARAYHDIRQKYDNLVEDATVRHDQWLKDREEHIKQRVVAIGATVKGENGTAVYNGGRVSWNTKGLEGYALAHPMIKQFRTYGKPYVSLRLNKS
jgi:hypothetical protein